MLKRKYSKFNVWYNYYDNRFGLDQKKDKKPRLDFAIPNLPTRERSNSFPSYYKSQHNKVSETHSWPTNFSSSQNNVNSSNSNLSSWNSQQWDGLICDAFVEKIQKMNWESFFQNLNDQSNDGMKTETGPQSLQYQTFF